MPMLNATPAALTRTCVTMIGRWSKTHWHFDVMVQLVGTAGVFTKSGRQAGELQCFSFHSHVTEGGCELPCMVLPKDFREAPQTCQVLFEQKLSQRLVLR